MTSNVDVSSAQKANIHSSSTVPRTGYADTKEYINHPWYNSQNVLKRKHATYDLDASSAEESSEDDAYTSDDRAGGMYPTLQSSHAQTRRISSLPASHSDGGHHSAKRRCVALEKNFAGMKIDSILSSSSGSYVLQQPQFQWPNAAFATSPDSDIDIPIVEAQNADSPLSQMSSISANSTRNNSPNVYISYLSPQMEMNYTQSHPGAGFVMPSNVEEPGSSPEIEKDGGLLPSLDINNNFASDKKRERERQAWFEPVKDRIVITDLDALASSDSEDNDVDNDETPKARSKIKSNLSSSGINPRRLRFNLDGNVDQNPDEVDSFTMNALMLKYIKKHAFKPLVDRIPDSSSDSNDVKKSDAMALIPFRPVAPYAPQAFGTVPLPAVNDVPLVGQGQGEVGGLGMNVQIDSDLDMNTSMNGDRMESITNSNSMLTSSMSYATGMEDSGMDVDDPMDVEY